MIVLSNIKQDNLLCNRDTLLTVYANKHISIEKLPVRRAYRIIKNRKIARLLSTVLAGVIPIINKNYVDNYSVIIRK